MPHVRIWPGGDGQPSSLPGPLHPYGEFNLVVPIDETAELMGPLGWCHAGWTAPAPREPSLSRGQGRSADSVLLPTLRPHLL